jgi:hypothetical protein
VTGICNTDTIEILKEHNVIANALFSLIKNTQSPSLYPIDLGDFLLTTKESQHYYILVEKKKIESIETITELIKLKHIPKDLKTVWVDIWFGSKEKEENIFDLFALISETLKMSLPENVEVIITDACDFELNSDFITVLGFD